MTRPTRIGSGGREVILGPGPGGAINQPPAPDCCDATPEDMPDRGLNENGAYTNSLTPPGEVTLVQSVIRTTTGGDVILPAPPTEGNLLVSWYADAQGTVIAPPMGWDVDANLGGGTFGFKRAYVSSRIAGSAETTNMGLHGDIARPIIAEFHHPSGWDSGRLDVVDIDKLNGGGDNNIMPADLPEVSPVQDVVRLWIGMTSAIVTDPGDITWPVGLAEAEDDFTSSGGQNVGGALAWASVLTSGDYDGQASSGQYVATAMYKPINDSETDATWTTPQPRVGDGDDATATDPIEGPDLLQRDLQATFQIVRSRLRLETDGTGSRTYTITAWNELDESDAVTLTTVNFTATGSAQDVEWSWSPAGAYRFYRLSSSSSEDVIFYTWEMYEPTIIDFLDIDHPSLTGRDEADQHPADSVSVDTTGFDNSDATELQGLAEDFDAAITTAATGGAALLAGFPRPLMAFDPDLDMWFVVVDGDGTAVMVTG